MIFGYGFLMILVQVVFGIHAYKTGRMSPWLWFIVLVPVIGCLLYFLIEMLPELARSRVIGKTQRGVEKLLNPEKNLKNYSQQLEVSNNVGNTLKLSEEMLSKGLYSNALEIIKKARKGLFEDDPVLLLNQARAEFQLALYADSKATLDYLIARNPDFKSEQGHLLYARNFEALRQDPQALHEYQALIKYAAGAEIRYRYAVLLHRMGQLEQAQKELQELLLSARNSPGHYRKRNEEWLSLSERELQAIKRS